MKSVLQAAWLMTVASGNLIVIMVAETGVFGGGDDQAREFFSFSLLMLLDTLLLAWLASGYTYSDFSKRREAEGDVGGILINKELDADDEL